MNMSGNEGEVNEQKKKKKNHYFIIHSAVRDLFFFPNAF